MIRLTYNLLKALITGLSGNDVNSALLNMQKSIDYLIQENRVLREQLKSKTGCKRIILTDAQRRRLAAKGFAVGREGLKHITDLFQSAAILGWYSKLVAQKYNGAPYRRKSGRPRVSQEIIERSIFIIRVLNGEGSHVHLECLVNFFQKTMNNVICLQVKLINVKFVFGMQLNWLLWALVFQIAAFIGFSAVIIP